MDWGLGPINPPDGLVFWYHYGTVQRSEVYALYIYPPAALQCALCFSYVCTTTPMPDTHTSCISYYLALSCATLTYQIIKYNK